MKLINQHTSSAVSFNGYFIESAGNQLNSGSWSSLESVDLDGNGVPDDGIGWEEFDAVGSDFLAEGFLTGESTLSPGGSLSLGLALQPEHRRLGQRRGPRFQAHRRLGANGSQQLVRHG